MFNLFTKLLDTNQKEVNRLGKIAEEINSFEDKIKKLKEEDFAKKTQEFKERLKKGEKFARENVGRFRPGHGLPIKFLPKILGKKAKKDIDFATPLKWSLIDK